MHNTKTQIKVESKYDTENGLNSHSYLHFSIGTKNYILPTNEITYVQAEHVYVRIFTLDGKQILERCTLANLLSRLPTNH